MNQTITDRQEDILLNLYKYRFLNRIQIQKFLNHKHHKRIIDWLNDLTKKEYIGRIYSNKFGENTKPAIYYLKLNGIGFIKTEFNLHSEDLMKFYRNPDRSEDFIDRCILIGDIALTLSDQEIKTEGTKNEVSYRVTTATGLSKPKSRFPFLSELKIDLLVKKQEEGNKTEITYFIFIILAPALPQYSARKKIKDIIALYDGYEWDETVEESFPNIMIICPSLPVLIYAKRLTKRLLEEEDNPDDLTFQFTTFAQAKKHGVTEKIWEAVK